LIKMAERPNKTNAHNSSQPAQTHVLTWGDAKAAITPSDINVGIGPIQP